MPAKGQKINRRRFIPNAKPGYQGVTVADPVITALAAKAPKAKTPLPPADDSPPKAPSILAAAIEASGDAPQPIFAPKGILAIERLGDTDHLADDFTLFTPEQRKFWKGAKARHRRITDDDKRKFVQELSRLPSVAAAAKSSGFAIRTWYCLRTRDPGFKAEWDSAIEAGVPVVEHAAMVRAFHGVERPIFQNGQRVGSELVMSDRLAEVLLRSYKPEKYSEKLMVAGQVNGTINHVHHLSPALEALAGKVLELGAPTIEGTALPTDQPPDLVAAVMGRLTGPPKPLDVVTVDHNTANNEGE